MKSAAASTAPTNGCSRLRAMVMADVAWNPLTFMPYLPKMRGEIPNR